ncbi:WD repeat-containing protein 44-like [Impatiens glandulifera]|uniref:WD repeat-containing protein 44-like n=1 Tax=Impatiens glandulifera TaxID=253017 RepID=UPI001FB0D749|nr:WD repeat-containing protein 44-like [Impatiens glandulifera]
MKIARDDEHDDDVAFYESLDRLLSSASSCTSSSSSSSSYTSSDNDDDDRQLIFTSSSFKTALERNFHVLEFPLALYNDYNVWISDPSSVEERRMRLLTLTGLTRDPVVVQSKLDCALDHHKDSTESHSIESFFPSSKETGVVYASSMKLDAYTIKDLDNGKQFVINEIREDGMSNKLKEVGTGRQLTVEEFEMSVGHSPIVQELMRRQNVELGNIINGSVGTGSVSKLKKKKNGSWLKSMRQVASNVTGRSSDEKDTSSEKGGGGRSSSATNDSLDNTTFHASERVRVRQYGKSSKELSGLYKRQEIQAHNGSIWTIKFSLDGKYLASAGEDCVIHVWQVVESNCKGDLQIERTGVGNLNQMEMSISQKSETVESIAMPETVFALSEKPICSFQGHLDDVLDLSWSKSQYLLSSSMDKTVRLWNMSEDSCLKIFSHNDFVTCIQFNPIDDRYFISGSLDAKVRIWSIPDCQVVDWSDLHEMVTAACYTPDGQGALVGSHRGSCHLYNTSENKLQQKGQVNLQNKKKKSHCKKITGFQFAPGSSSEVLVTSADSRIRVVDGVDLVHKFRGFRNTNSQISACLAANGKHIVCASEDSQVYIWKHKEVTRSNNKAKGGVTMTQSYEHFHCQDVTVAIPWPGMSDPWGFIDLDDPPLANHPPTPVEDLNFGKQNPLLESECQNSSPPLNRIISRSSNKYLFDRISATWPEEKLVLNTKNLGPHGKLEFSDGSNRSRSSAWGMVIVTAGLDGEIRTFQNFGLSVGKKLDTSIHWKLAKSVQM